MTLEELAIKYNSDKYYAHSYIPFYEQLFESRRNIKKLLEIGIGYRELMTPFVPEYTHGSSLYMWRDFFPEAMIYGCDVRQDILFQDERIRTYNANQSFPVDLLDLVGLTGGEFDIVIDDGSHEISHQIMTAKTLMPYVKKGGLYIIEDVRACEYVADEVGGKCVKFNKRPDDNLVVVIR